MFLLRFISTICYCINVFQGRPNLLICNYSKFSDKKVIFLCLIRYFGNEVPLDRKLISYPCPEFYSPTFLV